MFHWICPECGQEIAPGGKECPVCDPQPLAPSLPSTGPSVAVASAPKVASIAPVVEPPLPVREQFVEEPPFAVQAVAEPPVPDPPAVLQPEIVLEPEVVLQPKAFDGPQPPVVLDAIPVEAPVVMPGVPRGTSPVELPSPEPETFAGRLADLAERLQAERIPYGAPRIFQESAAPRPRVEPERAPVILDVTFDEDRTPDATPARTLLAPPPSMLLLAEPQPPAVAAGIPVQEVFHPRPAQHAAPSRQPLGAEPAAPSPVQLPDPPPYVAPPALAPLQDYYEAADRLMGPADYTAKAADAKALPAMTLPGPELPRELRSLQAAGLVPIRGARRQGEGPRSRFGWMTKSLVLGILLTAGVATYNMMPGTSTSAPPRPAPEPAPEPPVSARSADSLARFVEVTGIRFLEVNRKPQIHYLVVNHSSAPLNSVTVFVTLRAAQAKPGQPPLSRFSFRSPTLAAFEAKEMASPIERVIGPLDLPDWQDLHADVEVQ
jgi:hypothetical protein